MWEQINKKLKLFHGHQHVDWEIKCSYVHLPYMEMITVCSELLLLWVVHNSTIQIITFPGGIVGNELLGEQVYVPLLELANVSKNSVPLS